MDPISNVDQLVLLLRQRLAERARSGAGGRKDGASRPASARPSAIRQIASVDGVEDQVLRRALVQGVLVESLGEDLINDARFQQVVTRVTEALASDPDAGRLLSRLVTEVRASAQST